jgi:Ca2+-binding EF-hand superfamily protein
MKKFLLILSVLYGLIGKADDNDSVKKQQRLNITDNLLLSDKNGDKMITRDEFLNQIKDVYSGKFKIFDFDNDGIINEAEMEKIKLLIESSKSPNIQERNITKVIKNDSVKTNKQNSSEIDNGVRLSIVYESDSDNDGKINLIEYTTFSLPKMLMRFEKSDSNKDNALSKEELIKGIETIAKSVGNKNVGLGWGLNLNAKASTLDLIYSGIDKDKDNSINKSEFEEYSKISIAERFQKIDKNADHILVNEEFVYYFDSKKASKEDSVSKN